jgi:hypothetical protein
LGLLGLFIDIAIGIGIEKRPLIAGDGRTLSKLVSRCTSTAQHYGHAVQLDLAALALCVVLGCIVDPDRDFDSDSDFDGVAVERRYAVPRVAPIISEPSF